MKMQLESSEEEGQTSDGDSLSDGLSSVTDSPTESERSFIGQQNGLDVWRRLEGLVPDHASGDQHVKKPTGNSKS